MERTQERALSRVLLPAPLPPRMATRMPRSSSSVTPLSCGGAFPSGRPHLRRGGGRACPFCVRSMPALCPLCVRSVSALCPNYALCLRCVRSVSALCLVYVRSMSARCPRYVHAVSALCPLLRRGAAAWCMPRAAEKGRLQRERGGAPREGGGRN